MGAAQADEMAWVSCGGEQRCSVVQHRGTKTCYLLLAPAPTYVSLGLAGTGCLIGTTGGLASCKLEDGVSLLRDKAWVNLPCCSRCWHLHAEPAKASRLEWKR